MIQCVAPNKRLEATRGSRSRLKLFGGLRRRRMFIIEDEQHAEPQAGEFELIADAVAELKRRAMLPWDQPPNVAPCLSWRTCGRTYEIIEYDTSVRPWKELRRISYLEVSCAGVQWLSSPDLE